MNAFLILALFVSGMITPLYAQSGGHADTNRSTMVDDSTAVIALWKQYLFSRPDTTVVSPLWDTMTGHYSSEPDLSRRWLYFSSATLEYFQPHIEEVRRVDDTTFRLKTTFRAHDSIPGQVQTLAQLTVEAIYRGGTWKLRSPLATRTADWNTNRVGRIVYHYPDEHRFTLREAWRALRFMDSIATAMELTTTDTLHYYIAQSPQQMAWIVGLNYYPHPPYGLVYGENNMLFTALQIEFHRHELVHAVLNDYPNANILALEGSAVFFGGSLGQPLSEMRRLLHTEYADTTLPALKEVLANGIEFSLALYTYSGIMFESLFRQHGAVAVKKFLSISSPEEALIYWSTVMNIEQEKIDIYLHNAVREQRSVSLR